MVSAHQCTTPSSGTCEPAQEQSQSRLLHLWGMFCRMSLSKGQEVPSISPHLPAAHPPVPCQPGDDALGPPGKGEQGSIHPQNTGFASSDLPPLQTSCSGETQTENRGMRSKQRSQPNQPRLPVIAFPPLGWGPDPQPGPTQSSHTGPAGWGGRGAAGGRAGPATALAINSFHMHAAALPNRPLPAPTYQHTYSSACEGPKRRRGCSDPGALAPASCGPSWDGVPPAPRGPQGCG